MHKLFIIVSLLVASTAQALPAASCDFPFAECALPGPTQKVLWFTNEEKGWPNVYTPVYVWYEPKILVSEELPNGHLERQYVDAKYSECSWEGDARKHVLIPTESTGTPDIKKVVLLQPKENWTAEITLASGERLVLACIPIHQ